MTTYKLWKVGDNIKICASINEFCSGTTQLIYPYDIDVTKQPNDCTPIFGTPGGCGLHLNNVELTFKLVKSSGSDENNTCNPSKMYKIIGSVRTNSNGVANVLYKVTEQDRSDSIDAYGTYKVMVCITNSDGQVISSTISKVTDSITIEQSTHLECVNNVCTQVTGAGTNTCNTIGSTIECAPPSTATHYIEYDISALPTEVLTYISSSIIYISDTIVSQLPLDVSTQYISSSYNNGKFRIYVKYTPTLALSLQQQATIISFTLLFILIMYWTKAYTPWGIAAALIVSAFGAVIIYGVVINLEIGSSTNVEIPISNPSKKIEDIQKFADEQRAICDANYPCVAAKTCTKEQTQSYLLCTGLVDILQQTHDDTTAGNFDQTKFDELLKRFNDLSTGLNNDTLTVEEVLALLAGLTSETKTNSDEKKDLTTCETGFIYDPNTQKCVLAENCWIPSPFGGCIISAKTGKTITYIGGGLIVGYIGYKLFSSKKSDSNK